MNIKLFIDRPILSGVISVSLLFMGLIGLAMLPIEQFPEIAPPTISVTASYTGANAETVQNSVVIPLEDAINGVENMLYMTSTSSNSGQANISIYFEQGTNPDIATVNVQNRVSTAESQLPAEVIRSGVSVEKRQSSNLKIIALYSPDGTFNSEFLANYYETNIEPAISRIPGVGDQNVLSNSLAMRIWLDPNKMAQYGLVPSDINVILDEQNVEYPTGTLGENSENTFQYVLKYKGRYNTEEDYGKLVVKSLDNGVVVRLRDVARLEIGSESYSIFSEVNDRPGTICTISQTSGSNANEIIIQIDEILADLEETLPKGMKIVDLLDTKDFIDASFEGVVKTLIEAILLVILIVFIFLQSFRSTIIPTIAIIVSLVATFAFIYVAGFSLNILTLFALVLVIGTVVDDAIVVVEAVQTKFDEGYKSPYFATIDAMKEISSALVTTSLVFMAVFIPVCFTGGTTGTFYTQFGLTMAIAVGISTINALTLSPALCALIMKPHEKAVEGKKMSFTGRFHIAFEAAFGRIVNKYKRLISVMINRKWIAISLLLVTCVGLYILMTNTKTGLVPEEDMGVLFVNVQTSPASTTHETDLVMREVEKVMKNIPQIQTYSTVVGYSLLGSQGATNGLSIIALKPWGEREKDGDDVKSIIARLQAETSTIPNASVVCFAPPMISGYGTGDGFEMYVQDRHDGNTEDLFNYTNKFLAALNQRPEISYAMTTFNNRYPQYEVEVDAALCKRNGISPMTILETLSGYIGGNYASNMNKFSKLYRVMMQASAEHRIEEGSLNNMYVRNDKGQMSPISQYVTLTKVYGSETIIRFNLFPSISVTGAHAEGYSSGEAIMAVREVAKEVFPVGYGYEFAGMSREESSTGSSTIMIFAICFIFVYLILCALYESIFIPLAILLSVPFGLLGSFLFAKFFGLANDIYLQTGLLMIIGLLAKTAILLTEYASECRKAGMSIVESALRAAEVRLRPIIMTAATMIIGMLPLVFASGVGANGNSTLGVGIVGGMIIGTIALIFIVPVLFIVFQNIEERVMPKRIIPKAEEIKE